MAAPKVEGVDRVDQAESSGAHQVIDVDLVRKLRPDSLGRETYQVQVVLDQAVPQLVVRTGLERAPGGPERFLVRERAYLLIATDPA
jgi:hypothetical protein